MHLLGQLGDDAPEVAARCHRIVFMKDGEIVREEIPQARAS